MNLIYTGKYKRQEAPKSNSVMNQHEETFLTI